MIPFLVLTIGFAIGLAVMIGLSRREEIMANWPQYRADPAFLFTAFLFKPNGDPRSRFQFTVDNFTEVVTSFLTNTFKIFLAPVFQIFTLFSSSLQSSLKGFLGMRAIFGNMWRGFMDMISIFMNRFTLTFHRLRVVFYKLLSAFKRIAGVATSSIFMGLSALYSMLNLIDIMILIAIVILLVLVVLVIFFWFILGPFIPLILIVIGIISTTAFAGGVGGMSDTFCFGEDTQVKLQTGETVPLKEIKLGDILFDGGVVTACMEFAPASYTDLYSVHGITVAGSHILYTEETAGKTAEFVRTSAFAVPTQYTGCRVYCLNTTTHKIPVVAKNSTVHWFADWEEIDSDSATLEEWNKIVFETLNQDKDIDSKCACMQEQLYSEAAIKADTKVMQSGSVCCVADLRPGMEVLDSDGRPTKVTGVIRIAASEIKAVAKDHPELSCGAWMRHSAADIWTQGLPDLTNTNLCSSEWMTLTTESGTFLLDTGVAVRDFTDVGPDSIHTTYDWVLKTLQR